MAFGQAPSPFGAAPASTGFSFGAPAAASSPFGAPATSAAAPSLFGATPAPASSPFGATPSAAAAAPSLFGTPGSSPAFGAPAAAAAPSLFGTPPAASAPVPSLFGAASSAPAAGSAFSFGGGFGAATSAAPAAAPASSAFGLFGAPQQQQPQQQQAGGVFGALAPFGQQQQQQQQQQAMSALSPLAYNSAIEAEDIRRALEGLVAAYSPASSSYKFQALFLNVVEHPGQRLKPGNVLDELGWKQALRDAGGPDNPDRLWPVVASGFSDLLTRGGAQEAALAENAERLEQLKDAAYKLGRRQLDEVASRIAAARQRHVELSSRLLAVARHVDALEGRLANYMGVRGDASRGKETALARSLDVLEAQLSPTSPAGLQRRLDALSAACRLRASSGAGLGSGDPLSTRLDERSMQQLFSVLKEHMEGVRQLQEVLRRDVREVEVMRFFVSGHQTESRVTTVAAIEYV